MRYVLMLMFSMSGIAGELPEGWFLAGSNPAGYDASVVMDEGLDPPVAMMQSNSEANETEFGTVMQSFFPKDYVGKRVEMTVWIKNEKLENWAGAWLRIDVSGGKSVAFDNMRGRAIKGSKDWTQYSIVLDVPADAVSMNYGVLLAGKGQVWFDEFEFEVVDDSVAVTDLYLKKPTQDKPLNNSF